MELTVVMIGETVSVKQEGFDELHIVLCEKKEHLLDCLYQLYKQNGWVTVCNSGDMISAKYWNLAADVIRANEKFSLLFSKKIYNESNMAAPFSEWNMETSGCVNVNELPYLHTFFMEGTLIKAQCLADIKKFESYGSFAVMTFLIELQEKLAKIDAVGYLAGEGYYLASAREGDKTFCSYIYQREWYEALIQYFGVHFLYKQGSVPLIWQYHLAFLVNFCVEANLNNVSKRLFSEEEAELLLWQFGSVLNYVENSILLDREHFAIAGKNAYLRRWVYLILKYHDMNLEFEFWKEGNEYYYGFDGCRAGALSEVTVDIQAMEYKNGILEIDGRVSPLVWMNQSVFYVLLGKQKLSVEKRERYAHTKAFGVSIYKLQAFHVEIPIEEKKKQKITFISKGKWGNMPITLEYDSHFSRLSNRFTHSYWRMSQSMMLIEKKSSLMALPTNNMGVFVRESKLWFDMLKTKDKMIMKYIPVRLFLLCKPILHKKPIWLFIDKIYKAGDSSEYLYHYVRMHNRDIKCYYLLDKDSADYERMKKEGDQPLIRRSLKHRLVFLHADWIIISNSTVFAFNDFSVKNSAYIRDLIHFHVACVQHGMSVQKIAVAQNRLRDNIELYFCASKYEIENLSKPIYDYVDYSILKLTGVPRYDGLVNMDKKQILITPTWRMQAAVPVTKNESVARDYNPLFKETTYYRVYNSLINNKRLLNAAKRYGYHIVYVLHPIVSPQVEDFDKNEFVDIIPSIGDMSYEKIFCESSLMVTDFSGVQFDFAYMHKPLVYLHHKDIPQHYEEGTFHYDTMAFGEICRDNEELIDVLCEYMANGCVMKEKYRQRVDDFFYYNDHQNCKRIYDEMMKYTKKS